MPQLNNWTGHCQTYPSGANKMIRTSHWFCKQIRKENQPLSGGLWDFICSQAPVASACHHCKWAWAQSQRVRGMLLLSSWKILGTEQEFASGDMQFPCLLRLLRNLKFKSLSFHVLGRGFLFCPLQSLFLKCTHLWDMRDDLQLLLELGSLFVFRQLALSKENTGIVFPCKDQPVLFINPIVLLIIAQKLNFQTIGWITVCKIINDWESGYIVMYFFWQVS